MLCSFLTVLLKEVSSLTELYPFPIEAKASQRSAPFCASWASVPF